MSVLATKSDIAHLEERIAHVEEMQRGILSSVDRIATVIEKFNLEYAAIVEQLNRHDRWIREIAQKSGVTLSTS